MASKTVKRHWLKKIIIVVVIAELSYLILFNLALQLPMTQSLINQIKPEKFNIAWENAWTWYPFRFHIRGASGDGQSKKQQWAFEAQSVSASIAVTPLFFKRVWINNVQGSDASYSQRPRLKPDKDYSGLIAFYPPIRDRAITDIDTTPKKKKKPWHVDIEDIRLDGQFDYWVQQFKGQARATLEAELSVVSRGGLFSLTVPDMGLELGQHFIKGVEIFQHGSISGGLGFLPFVPRENRGIKLLQYLVLNTDLDIYVNSLAFVDLFTANFKDMSMDGTGRVDGQLHMKDGQVLDGTALSIDADDLHVGILSHMISGDGDIGIQLGADTKNQIAMDVRFNDLAMHHSGGGTPLFEGMGLGLNFTTPGGFIKKMVESRDAEGNEPSGQKKPFELSLRIPGARVADMSVFNHYFPPGSPFMFSSGSADLTADIKLKPNDAGGFIRLMADDMQAQIDTQSIRTDFSANIKLVDGVPDDRLFDISGTEFLLDDVRVAGDSDNFDQKNWTTSIMLKQAELVFSHPLALKTRANLSMTDSRPIVAMLGNRKDRPRWVKNMLIIDDVKGAVDLDMADNRIVLSEAFIDSEKIDVGAKAIIKEGPSDGVIYARYRKLDFLVRYAGGKRNIDLIHARAKFDQYQLPDEIK